MLVHNRASDGDAFLSGRQLDTLRNERLGRHPTVEWHVTSQGSRCHAGEECGLLDKALEELLGISMVILEQIRIDAQHQQAICSKTWPIGDQVLKAAINVRRGHKQDYRDRYLASHDHRAPAVTAASKPGPIGRLHGRRQIGACRSNRWNQA